MSTVDYHRVLNRVDDVIQINVMSADEGDFLATHMPFEHLEVTDSGLGQAQARSMSEEQVYEELVKKANDRHRFIIVKGNNGTGKSHLIRWMKARMANDQKNGELENEKIVFIRRIDNTLRGAISQLLEQGVVTDPEQQKRMRNFVNSVSNMSAGELKDAILDSFISQLRNDAEEGKIEELKKAEAQGYVELLNCEPVRNRMKGSQGPITRFYELISQPGQDTVNASAPHFTAEDFNLDKDKALRDEMQQYRSVIKLINAYFSLSRNNNAQKLADVLNNYSEIVIQRTANIGGEDTTQIMYNLRKELKKQGKSLTVFIEDMTTFTGIDSELIKILSEGHTGTYSDLCRVTSVIGITNAYYSDKFKGNFQDRVTHQVLVDERSFGNPDTLYMMAARYLNACYLTREEVQGWLQDGARPKDLPYRAAAPVYEWDSVKIGDDDFTLFPFTRRALVELFHRIDHVNQTPRNFLRAVVKEQFVTYLYNQLEGSCFPSVTTDAIGSAPVTFPKMADNQVFEKFVGAADDEEKKAFRALLCFWGNAKVAGNDQSLAGLPVAFINSLKYSFITKGIPVPEETGNETEQIPEKTEETPQKQETVKREFPSSLQKQLDDIDQWVQGSGKILQTSQYLRKFVADFLHDAVNWPMEGIPTYWVDMFLRDNRKVYIENQKEKVPTKETALIVLNRNQETATVLKGLAIRDAMKDWDFDESALYQVSIAVWLERNKREFIKRISDSEKIGGMNQLLMASMTVEFYYLGIMGGLNRDEAHLKEKLFKPKNELLAEDRKKEGSKRYDEWGKLIDAMFVKTEENRFKENKEILTRMIRSTTGEALASSDNVTVWGNMVDEALNTMRRAHWDFSSWMKDKSFGKDNIIESPFLLLQEYMPRVMAVLEDEKNNFHEICEKLPEYVEDPENADSWRETVKETMSFLKNLSPYNIGYPNSYETSLAKVRATAETLAAIVRNGKAVCEANQPSAVLTFFSQDPIEMNLKKAIAVFDEIRDFAELQKKRHEAAMKESVQDSALGAEVETVKNQITALMETLKPEVK